MAEIRETYLKQLESLIHQLEKEKDLDPHPNLIPQNVARIKNKFMEFDVPSKTSSEEEMILIINEYRNFYSSLHRVKILIKSRGRKVGAQIELSSDIIDSLMKDILERIRILEIPFEESRKNKETKEITRSKWAETTNVCELWPDSEDYNENRVFYVGPFAEPYSTLFFELVKPTVESFGVECYRDDAKKISEKFLKRILTSIKTSRLVIADLSLDRPNVLYELGWVSSIATPSLIVTSEERPSDLSLLTIEKYDFTTKGLAKLVKLIQAAMIEIGKTKTKEERTINYSKIIRKYHEDKISDAKLLWTILDESLEKTLFNNEIKIKKADMLTREILDLTPFDLEALQATQKDVNFITRLVASGKSLDSFKKECESFNKELEKLEEEELEKYIFQKTCFDFGEEIVFCFFNEGIHNLEDGHIECNFPESIIITKAEEPERPVNKKPELTPVNIQIIQNMEVLSTSKFFSRISTGQKYKNVDGPTINNLHSIEMDFGKIIHHQSQRFPESISITAFECGEFSIEWKLYLEGFSEPIVGVLNLVVED